MITYKDFFNYIDNLIDYKISYNDILKQAHQAVIDHTLINSQSLNTIYHSDNLNDRLQDNSLRHYMPNNYRSDSFIQWYQRSIIDDHCRNNRLRYRNNNPQSTSK